MDSCHILFRIPYPHFFSQHASVGGHIAHALGLVQGLTELGCNITVLAHEGRESFESLGASFFTVPRHASDPVTRQWWLRRFFRASQALTQKSHFDFIYTRYSASAVPHLIRDARSTSLPSVVEINSFASLHRSYFRRLDQFLLSQPIRPVVISDTLKAWALEKLGVLDESSIHVVPNGVGSDRFRYHESALAGSGIGTFNCAYAGLLKPDYGLECVAEAASMLHADEGNAYVFHVFGAGPFERALAAHDSETGNFRLRGELPFAEIPDHLCQMDCLIYTTATKNHFQSPIKLYEYMAIGKPIVAARTPQTEQLLRGGELGELYEMGSSTDLCRAVRKVRNDYTTAMRKAELAREVAWNEHRWYKRAEKILEIAGVQ